MAPKRKRTTEAESDNGCNWSVIPEDIVCLIAHKLNLIEDYVRFCVVCRYWYLFATQHYSLHKKIDFAPFLMVREDPDSSTTTTKRTFESYASGKNFTIDLPEAAGRRCWGSPYGWIITYGSVDHEFSLLNPFSRATIPLPAVSGEYSPYKNFVKAILTASPDSPHCLVILITGPSEIETLSGYGKPVLSETGAVLGFVRPTCDCSAWTRIEGGPSDLNDVVHFKGRLYGCRRHNLEVVLIDVDLQPPRATEFSVLPLIPGDRSLGCDRLGKDARWDAGWDRRWDGGWNAAWDAGVDSYPGFDNTNYLVVLEGELCLVLRYASANALHYLKFFNVNLNTKKWTRFCPSGKIPPLFLGSNSTFIYNAPPATATTDHFKLFLGSNSTFIYNAPPATATTDHFQPNFVYYTQDDDLTPYSLDQGLYIMVRDRHFRTREKSVKNPSLWMTPYLRFCQLEDGYDPKR